MSPTETQNEITPEQIRHQQIDKYWAGDLGRRVYLLRRQRKAILENCRRIAVIGATADPNSPSFAAVEKLLGLSLEIIPVFPDRESFLGLRCYRTLRDVPGKIDIVQVYPNEGIDFVELARAAVDRCVSTFWIEQGVAASREVEDILAAGRVQLVEYENLEREYLKHIPLAMPAAPSARRDRKAAKVKERMSKSPATVQPDDLVKVTPETTLKEAAELMLRWQVGGLPVVGEKDKLIGIITYTDLLRELVGHE